MSDDTVTIRRASSGSPAEGEKCVVVGWPLGEDGRKLFAGTGLYGSQRNLLAVARQVWILLREDRPA